MSPLHADAVSQLVTRGSSPADDVLAEMNARADRDGFPTVGPEVGRTLAMVTRLLGARSVLELGSGFGYSAYWIARALPADGSIVITERDPELLDAARLFFERGGLANRTTFVCGDAIDVASRREGPFDLVVLDHDTSEYVDGFETVRESVAPGGAIVADNVVATETTEEVLRLPDCSLRSTATPRRTVGRDPSPTSTNACSTTPTTRRTSCRSVKG